MAVNTTIQFEMGDGSVLRMTLAYRLIKRLHGVNKSLYERYNKVMSNGPKDELDSLTVLYAAYICACIQDGCIDCTMSEDEFIDSMTNDREAVNMAVMELVYPKKAEAFKKRLAAAEESQNQA